MKYLLSAMITAIILLIGINLYRDILIKKELRKEIEANGIIIARQNLWIDSVKQAESFIEDHSEIPDLPVLGKGTFEEPFITGKEILRSSAYIIKMCLKSPSKHWRMLLQKILKLLTGPSVRMMTRVSASAVFAARPMKKMVAK